MTDSMRKRAVLLGRHSLPDAVLEQALCVRMIFYNFVDCPCGG